MSADESVSIVKQIHLNSHRSIRLDTWVPCEFVCCSTDGNFICLKNAREVVVFSINKNAGGDISFVKLGSLQWKSDVLFFLNSWTSKSANILCGSNHVAESLQIHAALVTGDSLTVQNLVFEFDQEATSSASILSESKDTILVSFPFAWHSYNSLFVLATIGVPSIHLFSVHTKDQQTVFRYRQTVSTASLGSIFSLLFLNEETLISGSSGGIIIMELNNRTFAVQKSKLIPISTIGRSVPRKIVQILPLGHTNNCIVIDDDGCMYAFSLSDKNLININYPKKVGIGTIYVPKERYSSSYFASLPTPNVIYVSSVEKLIDYLLEGAGHSNSSDSYSMTVSLTILTEKEVSNIGYLREHGILCLYKNGDISIFIYPPEG